MLRLGGSRKSVIAQAKINAAAKKKLQSVSSSSLTGNRTGKSIEETIAKIEINSNKYLKKYVDKYELIQSESRAVEYFDKIIEKGIAAIDTETTGLDTLTCKLVGLCSYVEGEKPCYIPINHVGHVSHARSGNQLSEEFLKTQLDRCEDVKWVFHNAKYDIRVLRHTCNVYLKAYWDTMIAARLLNENESAALKNLHLKYCKSEDTEPLTISKLFDGLTFSLIPIKYAYLYAAGDAIKTWELYQFQKNHLENSEKLKRVNDVFRNIEMPMIEVLADMEDRGFYLDQKFAKQLQTKYHKLLNEAEAKCYECLIPHKEQIDMYKRMTPNHKLSDPISLSSPVQIAILLYDILKLTPNSKKNYGRGTGEEVLQLIDHPFCEALLEYRGVNKLITTYVDKLPAVVHEDGKIHALFNQYGANTGRLSSSEPNLQNVPSKNKEIRKMFRASEGKYLVSGDFSQQEPRLLAHMSQDENFKHAYMNNRDIYAWCASLVYNNDYEDNLEFRPDGTVNPEGKKRRTSMKSLILGIMYGRGPSSIAEQLGVSVNEAKSIITKFHQAFPKVEEFTQFAQNHAKQYGFVETAYGRKRRLPDMRLPEIELKIADATKMSDFDPLDFESSNEVSISRDTYNYYANKMHKAYGFSQKQKVRDEAEHEGLQIIDNGGKIADAQRQCVNCVSLDTEILTTEGWKAYNEVQVGDKIISFNPQTLSLGKDVIQEVHLYEDGNYDCINFYGLKIDAIATLNHRWVNTSGEFRTSEDIQEDDFYIYGFTNNSHSRENTHIIDLGICMQTKIKVDKVWCVTTKNGTWIARRNGKSFITGNSIIQGSASDVTKKAMINIAHDPKLNELGFELISTIHDEVIGECPKENAFEAADRLEEVMIAACADEIEIPMKVDCEISEVWYGENIPRPDDN